MTSSTASAQHWEFKNPLPTAASLRKVRFIAPAIAVVAGDQGNVLISTDGGTTWKSTQFDSRETSYQCTFSDPQTGWIVGTGGLIAKSTDGGMTWKILLQDAALLGLYDAYFPDRENGLVVGERLVVNGNVVSHPPVLLRTHNGGSSWSTEFIQAGYFNSIFFLDRDQGWASTWSEWYGLVKTQDGGKTWNPIPAPAAEGFITPTFFAQSRGICHISGWNGNNPRTRLFQTTDSGQNWICVLDTALLTRPPTCVSDIDFWMISSSSEVMHSIDGGRSWLGHNPGFDDIPYDIAVDGSTVIAVGASGHIWQSTDSGRIWRQRFSGPRNTLRAITFVDSTGWAVGGGGVTRSGLPLGAILLHTTDRGEHWEPRGSSSQENFSSVAFCDQSNGWLGGSNGMILRSTDAGSTWTPQSSGALGAITQLRFLDTKRGWASSSDGKILFTTNGGGSWQSGSVYGSVGAVTDLWMTDERHGFAVGSSNTILRTGNGGVTWDWTGIPGGHDYQGVCFLDSYKGFVLARTGQVLKTTNGGDSWDISDLGVGLPLSSIGFLGPDTGFIAGEAGILYLTTNGGDSWRSMSSGSQNPLLRVAAFPGAGAWAVGEGGTIINFVTARKDILAVANPVPPFPESVSLHQNYPNPFNASTTIRFEIRHATSVTLTVFNVLGQKVASLIDGYQEAGYHEVKFDGTALASGVYFYRLQYGNFVESKKLSLLR